MGNLGDYEQIVTDAKAAGGVANLVKSIERGAVVRSAPWIFASGVAATLLTVGGGAVVTLAGRRALNRADVAKARLEAEDMPAFGVVSSAAYNHETEAEVEAGEDHERKAEDGADSERPDRGS
jgi:hypothetical protein